MSTTQRILLAQASLRALVLAILVGSLAACDMLPGGNDLAAPREQGWQALPLRSFLTRPSVRTRGVQFCRVDACGYDAAVARFTATGDEGEALVAAIEDPEALVEMIRGKSEPDKIKARVDVQPTTINEWKGVEIAIEGGKKERQAFGVALLRRGAKDVDALVVVAAHLDLARRIAAAATE